MAKKSKTQRAKASAARKERKIEREQEELASAKMAEETGENTASAKATEATPAKAEPKKIEKAADSKDAKSSSDKKSAGKPKKQRFQFFRDVRSELRRVTWPTRTDVLRWTGVVVVALLFFGVFVALLDNVVITPLLVFISGFGA